MIVEVGLYFGRLPRADHDCKLVHILKDYLKKAVNATRCWLYSMTVYMISDSSMLSVKIYFSIRLKVIIGYD